MIPEPHLAGSHRSDSNDLAGRARARSVSSNVRTEVDCVYRTVAVICTTLSFHRLVPYCRFKLDLKKCSTTAPRQRP